MPKLLGAYTRYSAGVSAEIETCWADEEAPGIWRRSTEVRRAGAREPISEADFAAWCDGVGIPPELRRPPEWDGELIVEGSDADHVPDAGKKA